MKYLILTLVLSITSAHAQLQKGLEAISGDPSPVATCEDCADDPTCPQNLMRDVLNSPMTFMGREIMPGSNQNYSCVYRGATAYIIYGNCMGSKREGAATDIKIMPFTGGMISFYVENSSQVNTPISTMQRSQYDSTWRVSFQPSPATGTLNMAGVKSVLESANTRTSGGCYVGASMGAQDMAHRGACYGGYQNETWMSSARDFWQNPGTEWPQTLQRLRTTVTRSY